MKRTTSLVNLCLLLAVVGIFGMACAENEDEAKQKELQVKRELLKEYQNKLEQLDTELQNLSKDYETAYQKIRDSQDSIEAKLATIQGLAEDVAKHEALLAAQLQKAPTGKDITEDEPDERKSEGEVKSDIEEETKGEGEDVVVVPVEGEDEIDESAGAKDKDGIPLVTILLNAVALGLIFILFVVLFRLKNSSGEDFDEEPEVIIAKGEENGDETPAAEPERKEISIDITDEPEEETKKDE